MVNVTLIRIMSGVLAASVFLLPLYVLPTILAWKKTHRTPILLLNLFLGWTLLGWIAALVWAFSAQHLRYGLSRITNNANETLVASLVIYEESLYHSLTLILANEKRTLV